MFGWIQFLGGAVAGLFGSEALEEFFEGYFGKKNSAEGIPEQTTFGRIAIAVATGLAIALFIEYLKRKKII